MSWLCGRAAAGQLMRCGCASSSTSPGSFPISADLSGSLVAGGGASAREGKDWTWIIIAALVGGTYFGLKTKILHW